MCSFVTSAVWPTDATANAKTPSRRGTDSQQGRTKWRRHPISSIGMIFDLYSTTVESVWIMKSYAIVVLLLLLSCLLSDSFFLPHYRRADGSSFYSDYQVSLSSRRRLLLPTTTTSSSSPNNNNNIWALRDKLWDRLEIEEDPEPYWYLLNCVATNEIDLLRQCREVCADMPEDAIKFVVPTEKKTRSHGANRMVTETKVKYPGYVFAKLRLCAKVYEAIQELDLCRSWMGTVNRKGHRKLPPAPVALNELEVEKFGLEEFEEEEDEEEEELGGVIVDIDDEDQMKSKVDEEALKAFQGLKVGDMVKVVVPGKFYNEDGIIRRLKDGKIFVRFYTYGSMFEYWMEPHHVRKLTELEVLRGLSGPTQPITQQDFDKPQRDRYGRPQFDESRPGDLRRNLMGGTQGGQRNRRQDRVANRYRSDRSGGDEAYRNDRNWNWYQDQKQKRQGSTASDKQFKYHVGSDQGPGGRYDWATGDVGSPWGRKPQRQRQKEQRRSDNQYDNRRTQAAIEGDDDWSSFVTPAASPSGASSESDTDDFFSSLMEDLSKDLDGGGKKEVKTNDPWGKGKQSRSTVSTGDDSANESESFFDALESELADGLKKGPSSPNRRRSTTPQTDENEDFFAKLEAELGSALDNDSASSGSSKDVSDDFFSQLEAELAPIETDKATGKDSKLDDILNDILEDESNTKEASSTRIKPKTKPNAIKSKAEIKVASSAASSPAAPAPVDHASLDKCTVPVLKEMLRERGLKVSGKKSELIERLKQGK